MKLIHAFIIVLSISVLSACNLVYENVETKLSLEGEGVESLFLNLGSGDVEIVGEEREDIQVTGILATASDSPEAAEAFREENMTITLEKKDESTAEVITKMDFTKDQSMQARIHLKVAIPKHLHIDIRQEAGELLIKDLNNDLNVNHGLMDMIIENIQGNVKIMDGQGNIALNSITGTLSLNNSLGSVNITDHKGDMKVVGGPGSVEIQEALGNIEIVSGTGNIKIDSVTGDVRINGNQSGNVELTNINGEVIQ